MEDRARAWLVLAGAAVAVVVGLALRLVHGGSEHLARPTLLAAASEGARANGLEGQRSSAAPAAETLVARTAIASDGGLEGPAQHPDPTREPTAQALGKSARLAVYVTRAGAAVPGLSLEVSVGLDERVPLVRDADGVFRAVGLFPGFARLAVRGAGAPFERELVLRPLTTQRLELDLAARVEVRGNVRDPVGAPLCGARVCVDGTATWTDVHGDFIAWTAASGTAVARVSRDGFAPARARIDSPTRSAARRLEVRLEPACTLVISLDAAPQLQGPVRVVLVPGSGSQRSFAWADLEPLEALAGGTADIRDLPPGEVELLVLHATGVGRGRAVLRADRPARITIALAALGLGPDRGPRTSRSPSVDQPVRAAAQRLGPHAGLIYTRPLATLIAPGAPARPR